MSPSMLDAVRARWRSHDLLLREGEAAGLWDGTQAWPDFAAWCQAHRGRRCRLWLSQALLHELVCDAALPLRDDAAVLAWARPLLQHYHGDAALAWPLAAWQQGRRRGVSVLHGASLDGLRSTAQAAGVQLQAVRPWWSLLLQRAVQGHRTLRGAHAQLLVLEGDRIAALRLERGALAALELRRLDTTAAEMLAPWLGAGAPPTLALGYGSRLGWPGPGRLDAHDGAEWLTGAPA